MLTTKIFKIREIKKTDSDYLINSGLWDQCIKNPYDEVYLNSKYNYYIIKIDEKVIIICAGLNYESDYWKEREKEAEINQKWTEGQYLELTGNKEKVNSSKPIITWVCNDTINGNFLLKYIDNSSYNLELVSYNK